MTDTAKMAVAAALVVLFGIFVAMDQWLLRKSASAAPRAGEAEPAAVDPTGPSNKDIPQAKAVLEGLDPRRSNPAPQAAGPARGNPNSEARRGESRPMNDKAENGVPGQGREAASGPPPSAEGKVPFLQVLPDGRKVYTVQQGDTLYGISNKVYNNPACYEKLYEANRDKIDDPNTVRVGLKLSIPDLPSKALPPGAGAPGAVAEAGPVSDAPEGAPSSTVCPVQPGDSLWRIAEKYALERKTSILEMMKQIVQANPGKLKDLGTAIQVGWQLVIPEENRSGR
jgi:nucleoid-associated protein YgaU